MQKSTQLLAVIGGLILIGLVAYFAPRAHRLGMTLSSEVRADISTIESACQTFAELNGARDPHSIQLLVVPDVNGQSSLRLPSIPCDPWGREYLDAPPAGPGAKPRIWTHGRDGSPRGQDEDWNVGNWILC